MAKNILARRNQERHKVIGRLFTTTIAIQADLTVILITKRLFKAALTWS